MTETPTSDAHRGAAVPAESILEAVEDAFGQAQPRTSSSAGGLRQAIRHDRPAGSPDLARAPVSRAESWGAGAAGGLGSLSVEERRGLLETILATGIASEQVEPVTRVLLNDPDPELRRLAARALAGAEPVPRPEVVRRGLLDPDDSVRAAVVTLAARAGVAAISTIVPLVADRTWPVAQHAAVEELTGFVREAGPLAEPDHDRLLAAVAALDPPPLSSEREALKDLARAIGVDRLATDLRRSGDSQIGAARLLTAEGSTAALQAVTARRDDGPEEIHALAQRAAAELDTRPDAGRPVAPSLPATRETETAGELGSDEILSILGVALDDPSEAVRDQARAALRMLGRGDVIAAVERSLRTGDDERAATAAGVAGALGLIECGPALLGRAASFAEVERGPFLRALAALGIGPEDLSSLLSAQDAAHRPRAVRVVWEIAGRAVLPFLVGLLEDSMGAVRMAVLEVFAESGDPSAATLAFELLQRDSSAAVRAAAVHALARSGGEVRLRGLAMALADADPDVRATAVETLPAGVMVPGRLPEETPQPSAQALARALDDPDERVARAAASRLAGIAGREGPAVWAAIRDRPAARTYRFPHRGHTGACCAELDGRWASRTRPSR